MVYARCGVAANTLPTLAWDEGPIAGAGRRNRVNMRPLHEGQARKDCRLGTEEPI